MKVRPFSTAETLTEALADATGGPHGAFVFVDRAERGEQHERDERDGDVDVVEPAEDQHARDDAEEDQQAAHRRHVLLVLPHLLQDLRVVVDAAVELLAAQPQPSRLRAAPGGASEDLTWAHSVVRFRRISMAGRCYNAAFSAGAIPAQYD